MLLYLTLNKGSLKTKYFGPYVVNKKVSTTGYIIDTTKDNNNNNNNNNKTLFRHTH